MNQQPVSSGSKDCRVCCAEDSNPSTGAVSDGRTSLQDSKARPVGSTYNAQGYNNKIIERGLTFFVLCPTKGNS